MGRFADGSRPGSFRRTGKGYQMARKNRVSVYDGIYHVTSRIANRAMLLAEDEVKDRIMEWTVSVAAFSGVEVWAFCIMDNHLHLFVHVPPVPERLWLDPDDEPAAYAFGMRPPECREPLWSPGGDCPPPPRPELGFMLDDAEMLGRLGHLYGPERADAIGRQWEVPRANGRGIPAEGVPSGGDAIGPEVPRIRLGAAASGLAEGRGVGSRRTTGRRRPPEGRSVPLRQSGNHKRRISSPAAERCLKRPVAAIAARCAASSTCGTIFGGGLSPFDERWTTRGGLSPFFPVMRTDCCT